MKNFWENRKVLVTGATGLLGSWLVEALCERRAEVVAIIRDNVPRSKFHLAQLDKKTITVRGALEDYRLIERTLNEYEIELVFHLGAQTIVETANRSPLATFESNIQGTWHLLEAARVSPLVKGVVVASSDKAYGGQEKLPYVETAPLQGRHMYDVSKSCADLIAQAYAATYSLPLAIVRCGNIFGGGDLNFNRLIPGTMQAVVKHERPVLRSDGTPKRDYFYVADAALAYLKVAEALERPEVKGQAFNFGTNTPLNPVQVVEAILRLADVKDLTPEIRSTWQGEIQDQYLDSTRARRVLGWEPQYTFEAAIRETLGWYRDYFKAPDKK